MKHLVIDTETTGLYPQINKTLTVGMLLIEVNNNYLEILDSNHIFIRHENYNASPKALKVNKIDLNKHHQIAIKPKKACSQINSFIEKNNLIKTPILGHNISFDRGFIETLFNQEKTTSLLSKQSIDTLHLWNLLKMKNRVPWNLRNNLKTLADFFKVDYSNAHNALADCEITAKVYFKMLKLL